MFEEFTKRKKPIPEKLTAYGFEKEGNMFRYSREIRDGEFTLTLEIGKDGAIGTELIEKETGEEYVLYKTNASGAYVGGIRAAIGEVVGDVTGKCYETSVFRTEQAQMLREFVRETYGDELEFLWTQFPDNAVWRRKDNRKWYGAILTVEGRKLGLESERIEEIVDLRMDPKEAEEILSRANYYPGWHMNKKSWYTLILDGSISDGELKERLGESYRLAGK
jgi:hypothetical protein